MPPCFRVIPLFLAGALATAPAAAQEYVVDLSQIDPAAILASAGDVLMRAPDAQIDALFQATHTAAQSPDDARLLCALFDPHADRSFESLAATANRLDAGSRERFAVALADIAASGLQNPRQPYDPAAAKQTLKSAGVTAMLLHDGFMVGMTTEGSDQASRDARCRSFGWMLDALADVPMAQRAAATRLMLSEGMAQLAPR
ncbi:hypothetical protein GCM10022229_02600 [Luteimonas lutimaris]|uniref:Sel1 repeat family protein n=1 Tax=Luteimonas lutimaris TaxID=698645 RepID=A0ABP7M4G3_9GAMM